MGGGAAMNRLKQHALWMLLAGWASDGRAEVADLSWSWLVQVAPQCVTQGCWHHWYYQEAPDGQQLMGLLSGLAEFTDAPLALEDEPGLKRLSLFLPVEPPVVQGAVSASSCLASACSAYEAMAEKSR